MTSPRTGATGSTSSPPTSPTVVYDAAWAAEITGVPQEQIEQIAEMMGTIKPMAINCGNGIGDQQNDGHWAQACIDLIEAITGNIGIAGGSGAAMTGAPLPHQDQGYRQALRPLAHDRRRTRPTATWPASPTLSAPRPRVGSRPWPPRSPAPPRPTTRASAAF